MKRSIAFLVALALVCALFFVVLEAQHNCAGDNCEICGLLDACLQTLRLALCSAAAAALTALAATCRGTVHTDRTRAAFTLIIQKVKLSC